MRPIPQSAIDLITRWEGLRLSSYPDPASGGEPWTIGYGHTGGVKPGDRISEARARVLLKSDLARFATAISQKLGPVVDELTDNQYAALLSLVFNVGPDAPKTLYAKLRRREFDQAPMEFLRFVNARGRKLQGLVNRRTDEVRVWSIDEPGSADIRLTSGELREMETPPTAADPTPSKKSVSLWAAICAAVLGFLKWIGDLLAQIPDFASTAINAINPFAQKSEWAAFVVNGLGGLGAVAGVYVAWSILKKKREARS